jgi:hypothetical protein
MRSLGFILFVGVLIAVGCFLDASSQTARAVNCDNVCNVPRIRVICNMIGTGSSYTAVEFYIPACPTEDNPMPGEGVYTYKNANGQTVTINNFPQWDTSTEQSGSCAIVKSNGNQRRALVSADQACPCPCTGNFPTGQAGVYCQNVEGTNPGAWAVPAWRVINLGGCVAPPKK